jgi:ABC-type uncharacterized transport system involved in gliding motility auxiliary subunit
MTHRAPILGIVGLVLLLFGAISHWMTHDPLQPLFAFGWYSLSHLVVGTLCLAVYFATGSSSLLQFVRQRSTRYGLNSIVYSVLFVTVIVMANFMSSRYHTRFDMSVENVNSLSPQSVSIVRGLEAPLHVDAFVEAGGDAVLEELLRAYADENEDISYRIIDPQVHPELAQAAAISQLPTIRLQLGEKSTLVTSTDEEAVTNGIHRLTTAETKRIYFVEGHGEPSIEDSRGPEGFGLLAEALRNQNYDVAKLFLPDVDAIPEDAAVVVVASGEKPLFPREIEHLDAHLRAGGRVLFMLEPQRGAELADLLARFGVSVGDDVIVDRQIRLFEGASLGLDPVVSQYSDHPAVSPMSERTVFSLARSVAPAPQPPDGLVVQALAFAPKTTWAETDVARLFEASEASLDEGETEGPIPLAVAASAFARDIGGEGDAEMELVVFGDTTFATNRYLRQLFNDALLLSTVGWLAGQEELISIGARAVRASRAQLSAEEARSVFYLSVLVLPELILLCGVAVWWRRSAA